MTVTVDAGTYATAASFQTELQSGRQHRDQRPPPASPARSRSRSPTSAAVCGRSSFARNSTDTDTRHRRSAASAPSSPRRSRTAARRRSPTPAAACSRSARTSRPTNQIHVVDRRRPHHRRHERHLHGAGEHRRHQHRPRTRIVGRRLVDAAIASVSALRGQLGADQNRFQSTIATCRSPRRTSPLRRAASVTPTWRSEMVNFTKNQILLQAGTAMLAQANAAPQTHPEAPPVRGSAELDQFSRPNGRRTPGGGGGGNSPTLRGNAGRPALPRGEHQRR